MLNKYNIRTSTKSGKDGKDTEDYPLKLIYEDSKKNSFVYTLISSNFRRAMLADKSEQDKDINIVEIKPANSTPLNSISAISRQSKSNNEYDFGKIKKECFDYINDQVIKLEKKMTNKMNRGFIEVNNRIDLIEKRLDSLDNRLDSLEKMMKEFIYTMIENEKKRDAELKLIYQEIEKNRLDISKLNKKVSNQKKKT